MSTHTCSKCKSTDNIRSFVDGSFVCFNCQSVWNVKANLPKPNLLICKSCKTPDFIVEHDYENVCHNCGLVVGSPIISDQQEWRDFEDDANDKSRVGYSKNGSLDGTYIQSGIRGFSKMIRYHNMTCVVKSPLEQAKDRLHNKAENHFELYPNSSIVEKITNYYIDSIENYALIQGIDDYAILGVFCYHASKCYGKIIPFSQIKKQVFVPLNDIHQVYTHLQGFLESKSDSYERTNKVEILDGLGKHAGEFLELSKLNQIKLTKVLHLIQTSELEQGLQAKSKVALALFLAFHKQYTPAQIVASVGTTTITLSNAINAWKKLRGKE